MPAERLAALRAAFEATTRDADFIADAARLYTDIDAVSGPHVLDAINAAYATPRNAIARVRDAVMPKEGR